MPMVPPAPPTFSTTICWPSVRPMDSPTSRATASVGPPAAAGTMMVIAFDGYACWAETSSKPPTMPASMAAVNASLRRVALISGLPVSLDGWLFVVPGERVAHGARDVGGRGAAAEIGGMQRRIGGDALDRAHQAAGGGLLAEMLQHHDARPERADRIGDALAHDVEGRAVDRLEH